MMYKKFSGTGVALVTPFKEDLSVDFDALARLVNHVREGGVDYLVVNGTTAESPVTTLSEKREILSFIQSMNEKKLPIVYGIGGNNTEEVLKTIRETGLNGVDALLSVSPYYNKPSQEGIFRHYSAVADASPVPIILYNVPGRTSSNISVGTTLRLARHPNIIGTKEASGDLMQFAAIAKDAPTDFLLISGEDLLTTPMISIGGSGAISVLANAFPVNFSKMVRFALEGNYSESSRYLFSFMDINPLMYEESNPVGIKQTLASLGLCGNFVRLPLVSASKTLAEKINGALEKINEAVM